MKEEPIKMTESEDTLTENKTEVTSPIKVETVKPNNEDDNVDNRIECIPNETIVSAKEEFEDKSLAMNPEPPEYNEPSPERLEHTEFGTNPPNPNFKPIPELKSEIKPIDSLYSGLDDTEINTVITEKYSLLSENEVEDKETVCEEKSPKKDEFLAPVPELSKWERDDTIEKSDDVCESPTDKMQMDEPKSMKVVTSEVLKRAENAIFQKAINAIRPIEIKKISESRKILYQNPEPKVLEAEPTREQRKSVNVTINVGRNERNVEITEPLKKAKIDRTKFKPVPETYSPTRLSAKERLGDKVEDNKERKISPIKGFLDRRETKSENQSRSRSPKSTRDKRISPLMERRVDSSLGIPSTDRKVFLEERKRDKDRGERSRDRNDFRHERHELRDTRVESRQDFRSNRGETKGERSDKDREKDRERERRGRTPPCVFKRNEVPKVGPGKPKEDEDDRRRDKKVREDKKRKKEHRSRSKSKEHKKRKEKKHKKDKEKSQEKKQKHRENVILKEKTETNESKINYDNPEPPLVETLKKQRKNPRLVSDRKRSILDESSFEPDYSASDSESEPEDGKIINLPTKKLKLEESELEKDIDIKSLKKRSKSTSSEDTSSSSESTSSDSDSSDESHKKKKKKHKKHKKKKSTKKDSSSESDSYTDSSETSTDEEKHRKKSKKSKSRSKQSKKKKKSKHK